MLFRQIRADGDRNFAYLIGDEGTKQCAIIDPSYAPQRALDEALALGLSVRYVISTHSHKDHIAGNDYLLERTKATEVMHESSPRVCKKMVRDNEELEMGGLRLRFLHTPGHIPDHVCVLSGGKLLTGDILFVGKVGGTGSYFVGSDPRQQWSSLQRLIKLDPATEVWPGHDYGATPSSTIGREAASNPFLLCMTFEEFTHLKANWAEYKKLHNIK